MIHIFILKDSLIVCKLCIAPPLTVALIFLSDLSRFSKLNGFGSFAIKVLNKNADEKQAKIKALIGQLLKFAVENRGRLLKVDACTAI